MQPKNMMTLAVLVVVSGLGSNLAEAQNNEYRKQKCRCTMMLFEIGTTSDVEFETPAPPVTSDGFERMEVGRKLCVEVANKHGKEMKPTAFAVECKNHLIWPR